MAQTFQKWVSRNGNVLIVTVAVGLGLPAIWYMRPGWYPAATDEATTYAALIERRMGLRIENATSNHVRYYPRNWTTAPTELLPTTNALDGAWYLDHRYDTPGEGTALTTALDRVIGTNWWQAVTGTNYPHYLRRSRYINYYTYSQYAMPLSYMSTALLRQGRRHLKHAGEYQKRYCYYRSSGAAAIDTNDVGGSIAQAWTNCIGSAWNTNATVTVADAVASPLAWIDVYVYGDYGTVEVRYWALFHEFRMSAPTNFAGTMTGYGVMTQYVEGVTHPYTGPGTEGAFHEIAEFDFLADRDSLYDDGMNSWRYYTGWLMPTNPIIALDYAAIAAVIPAPGSGGTGQKRVRVGWKEASAWSVNRYSFQYLTNSAALVID